VTRCVSKASLWQINVMGVPFISNTFFGIINVLLTFSFEYLTQSEIHYVI